MKTIEIKLYKFNELPEEVQEKAIEKYFDINVDYDWWDFTYEDAENIGLKINGFDLDRGNYCNGEFILSTSEVAQNVLKEHGGNCDTYKTAENFLDEFNPVFTEYLDESSDNYESAESEDKMIYLETEFLNSLLEDYRIILRNEYSYLTSEKAIKETLIVNDYDFTENGEIY
jgi:hypothetical protein